MIARGGALLSLLLLAACSRGSGAEAPRAAATSSLTLQGLLAYPFYLVKAGGAKTLPPTKQDLLQGFGLTVRELQRNGEEPSALTASGLRVRMRDLEPPILSRFEGTEVYDAKLLLAWVIRAAGPVHREPSESSQLVARKKRLARVVLASRTGPSGWYQTNEGWMREADLAVPSRALRPTAVEADELWIDVELRSQTLVVYQGDRPTYATLISAGVGAPGSPFATPVGEHRITGKRLMTPMSNLDHRGVPSYYFYEEVPLAQFIGRVALHGVYWHDGFGQPRSHGCINLSLRDALRLFGLTKPLLPTGAVEITAEEKSGTVVRVR